MKYDAISKIKRLLIENPHQSRDDLQYVLRKDGQRISDFTVSNIRAAFLDDCRVLMNAGHCNDIWKGKPKPKRTVRTRRQEQETTVPRRTRRMKTGLEDIVQFSHMVEYEGVF